MSIRTRVASAVVALLLSGLAVEVRAAEVKVYWERGSYWPGTAFEDFTKQTGVSVVFPLKGERNEGYEALTAERADTQADLYITNNVANLFELGKAGLLAPVESRVLAANVPAHLRDPQLRWAGLAVRARVIMYNTTKVKPAELSTYEALGAPKWKGRLCLRTGTSPYNTLMLGSWIARVGERKTETIVKGWLANEPQIFDKDSVQLKALSTGRCDVAVVHTYYLGRVVANDPTFPVAVFWPDQKGAGVHIGVAGAAVPTHAKNRADAVRLLEYLTTPAAQSAFADANFEYPANPKARVHPMLAAWGTFKADDLNVAKAAELQNDGARLAQRLGWK